MLREWMDKNFSGPSRKRFDFRNLFLLIGFLMMRFSQELQVFVMSSLFSLTIMTFMPYQPTVHAQTIYVGIFYLRASSIKTYPMSLRCAILVNVVKQYGGPGLSHSIFCFSFIHKKLFGECFIPLSYQVQVLFQFNIFG